MTDSIFERSISLLGDEAFSRISGYRVAIFGVGGVGGWCAEALVRTGVRNITLVDDDIVAESNVNRQRQATPSTIGRMKVEALRDILLDIAPDAAIASIAERYTPASAARFDNTLDSADFVIDAIDSVDCKAHLIQRCANPAVAEGGKMRRPILFSSMGAALRTDPTRVRTSPFNKVTGDGLARALR
ncbi:MAG: ThiF family adenylyltransferase, partial [Kiritimatiellia bacterium]|nr:ThiF family adenylyltransferase [Kiritimatiellia bacterium]